MTKHGGRNRGKKKTNKIETFATCYQMLTDRRCIKLSTRDSVNKVKNESKKLRKSKQKQ